MNKHLSKYWLSLKGSNTKFGRGIGVTAYSEADVIIIVKDKIDEPIEIDSFNMVTSIDELEQNHVVPNMEEFISRGIWYPKGYK